MTQAEKDKIIKELQEKLAEAEKIEVDESMERWKPEINKIYYFLGGDGIIHSAFWYNDPADKWRYLIDNCFETKEEGEEYKKQIEYTARYKNYIEGYSKSLDWKDEDQRKYYPGVETIDNKIYAECYTTYKLQGPIYASSEQIIWDAIKEIGEDNFKKYVLGVE